MSRDPRTPTSVTCNGIFTVHVYDEQVYRENIRRYYPAGAINRVLTDTWHPDRVPFEKKKPSARYDWASWHEPMMKEELA